MWFQSCRRSKPQALWKLNWRLSDECDFWFFVFRFLVFWSFAQYFQYFAGGRISCHLEPPPLWAQGRKAAREFEAQLIGTVLESLEKTFAALPGQDAMAGQDDYNSMGTQALASALAAGAVSGLPS